MHISYRQACSYIKKINSLAETPLIVLKRGGKDGGGSTQITEAGDRAIMAFHKIQSDFAKFLEAKTGSLEI